PRSTLSLRDALPIYPAHTTLMSGKWMAAAGRWQWRARAARAAPSRRHPTRSPETGCPLSPVGRRQHVDVGHLRAPEEVRDRPGIRIGERAHVPEVVRIVEGLDAGVLLERHLLAEDQEGGPVEPGARDRPAVEGGPREVEEGKAGRAGPQ